MRKIATALDTGSASLCVYVKELNHLHALMLDAALEEVEDSPDLPAVERVKAILRSCLTVLLDRRGLASIAAVTMPRGTGSMRLNELLLDGLLDAGVRPERAAWGVDLITLHVTAKAAELTAWRGQSDVVGETEAAYERADEQAFPRLSQPHQLLFAGPGPRRFDWALHSLINGITQTPLPPQAAAPEHDADNGVRHVQ
ncbi:TetR/AcrR family transcriptional regulator C-terminal domain-containing protein [Streptomyces phaeochromogenes]|uniref:TetR/AcrR family transcriptional regulator C-terminal domain-containing protein n=1 Tax=Streptomyces phaeochromogenes TaxID=1923 RepID=UPI0033DD18B5